MKTYTYSDERTTKMRELFVKACNALNELADFAIDCEELDLAHRAHVASTEMLYEMKRFHGRITLTTDNE